ncbi:MAG: protoporphyrinogen oxidase HemJ [Rhodovulum sulfidophilum]|uniref:Protoporphyrinogen IX oxidase n=1 Tax=Rhodovulum sulfidophilum TaxID=35806 RepID=A0A2W5NHJ1_RHOSU|nr:MAG: protoporphyrinogen oxidase HemJ [Rhodovulum sulfidophilum]
MRDLLIAIYPWTKAFHVIAVITWMAGLFYLPRLYVYHAERGKPGGELSETLKIMETKLLKYIMNPAMIASWTLGLLLVLTPGVVDWSAGWFYMKLVSVLVLSWLQGWLAARGRDFAADRNTVSGRTYRLMNEVPTIALVVIVIMVIVRPF